MKLSLLAPILLACAPVHGAPAASPADGFMAMGGHSTSSAPLCSSSRHHKSSWWDSSSKKKANADVQLELTELEKSLVEKVCDKYSTASRKTHHVEEQNYVIKVEPVRFKKLQKEECLEQLKSGLGTCKPRKRHPVEWEHKNVYYTVKIPGFFGRSEPPHPILPRADASAADPSAQYDASTDDASTDDNNDDAF